MGQERHITRHSYWDKENTKIPKGRYYQVPAVQVTGKTITITMKNDYQKVEQATGRALLRWDGKKPLESVQFYPAQEIEVYGDKTAKDFNKLFWGDNLQVLSHLLKEYRGAVDLIYIDPPFDSKADYVRKVKIRGEKVEATGQGLFEEKQYSDIWEKDEYLQFMYERLLIMKELLSDTGSIFVHVDWHKGAHIKLLLDEVMGEENLKNEIIWHYRTGNIADKQFQRKHDTIYFYSKNPKCKFNVQMIKEYYAQVYGPDKKISFESPSDAEDKYGKYRMSQADDVWNISAVFTLGGEHLDYPTQKPEAVIERIIKSVTDEGDLIADFFTGSGTTQAVAQRLGRKWIGCDINKGAIQTVTKRLNQVIAEQQKTKLKDFKGSLGFKILNVNDYDVFKNEVLAKEIVMEMYGVEPIKRSYFDGLLGSDFVKVMPMNRVLNKMDIRSILKSVQDGIGAFTVKTSTKAKESVYEEKVRIICSGIEYDVLNFLKKENKTGVVIDINDVLESTKELIFKEYPESKIDVKAKGVNLSVDIKEFYSPLLMRKLEIENAKVLNKKEKAKVEDFKQIIDSVAIDVDFNGKLFNAEIIDLPEKKEVIKTKYSWEYPKKGKYTVAIKIVDVLGEEYFETFEVTA